MRTRYIKTIVLIGLVLSLLTAAFFWGDNSGKNDETGRVQSSPRVVVNNDKNTVDPKKDQFAAPGKDQAVTAQTEETSVTQEADKVQSAGEADLHPAGGNQQDGSVLANTCTLEVKCTTILDNMDKFNQRKLQVLPADGIIYPLTTVTFEPGESAYSVLQREMRQAGTHLETSTVPLYNSVYIEGINNIYELDCGELSGWIYRVNGKIPGYGCSLYKLQDGDGIEFVYTCDLGRDAGGNDFSEE